MPPSSSHNMPSLSADYRAWSTAVAPSARAPSISGRTSTAEDPVPRPQPAPQRQSMSHAQFEHRLSSKKDLKGGMTQRWLKEDACKDARKDLMKALAVLEGDRRERK
ncbi:hypothetical protein H2200_005725 [Cladophialophora chaetospira]|uniref:Uncharacterized protein n=1 Tax=Cladophialophora chaetospira TaxID=386627 RepID=A0AA38X9P8_9EURO|nr:hypothetical protein H2200_005725 [Cladophialophora chaetospira]